MESFLVWVLLGLFTCSSCLGQELPDQSCDPNDLLALKEFAGNLTGGSVLTAWSGNRQGCCNWNGVICENVSNNVSGSSSRVTKLLLSNGGLTGPIPPSLARLDRLVRLDLSFNQLKGEVPVQFSSLKQLKVLDLSHNLLSGRIWGSLHGLASIQSLNISSNLFSGDMVGLGEFPFPDLLVFNISNNSFVGQLNPQLCNISPGIHAIDLSRNHFTGSLDGLENCSNSLQQLHLDSNSFSGHIPDSLYAISSLEQLTISCNNFSGPLVDKLGKLSGLKSLVVYGNQFCGPFPDVFGNLTRLEQLVAHSNSFSGQLPSTLSLCSELRLLDLRNNSLMGPIDLNFTNLPHLCTLDLATNHFSGPLPSSLSDCTELKVLSLAKNELKGEIPQTFGNLTSLLFLSLSNNSFTNLSSALFVLQHCRNLSTLVLTKNFHGEEIPDGVTEFESLTVLALGNCGLKGQVPIWLLSCQKLQVLDLSWNRIEGSIPLWIGQMENLFYLDFSNNSISGEIPKSLTELKSLISMNCTSSNPTTSAGIPLYVKRNPTANGLQYNQISSFPPSIYLSNNRINGSIWPEIGRLKELHVLDISKNNISGSIPSSISDMENLEVLDLSNNNLTGSIPPSLNKLTFLSKFTVANNKLQGPIPKGTQFSGFSNSSFEGNPGLCGMIDFPCGGERGIDLNNEGMKPAYSQGGTHRGLSGRTNIIVITITLGLGFALLLAIVLVRMTKRDTGHGMDILNEDLGRPHRLSGALETSKLVLFQNSHCNDLTAGDLLKSTNNFNQANIIGCGGFGLVYKAYLPDGTKAAIKRLSGDCGQAEREFQAEVEALSRAQHKNLVSLQGYCLHGNERLLIYSYMENGSLDYWLHESEDGSSILRWDMRLKIAQGAARGLFYLHKVCEPSIVHRDVKSSNILLDDKFEAHLADFGLSRLLRPYDTHVTTDLVGTLGYIPPEYSQTLTATFRGDVYSFGVVLLELLTGRRPVEVCKGKNCRDLVSWVFQMRSEKRDQEVVDPTVWDKDHERQILEVLSVACNCTDRDPRRRPLIEQVVSLLDGVGFRGSESDHQQC